MFDELLFFLNRFSLFEDYGSELQSCVELCAEGELDADQPDTDLYDQLTAADVSSPRAVMCSLVRENPASLSIFSGSVDWSFVVATDCDWAYLRHGPKTRNS